MEKEFAADPPPGFEQSRTRGPYSTRNGPYFDKVEGARFWHGLRVQHRHCNAHGSLHGGMMSSFADGLLATSVSRGTSMRGVTVRMVCDLIGGVDAGAWLEGSAWVTGRDENTAFAEAEAFADGELVFTASGVFRIFPRQSPR
jgi:acyl-coenzyme A thioesterase PaaI-like protein